MKSILKTTKLVLGYAERSLFILGLSLITLGANELSVLAQTRQPTNAELRKLRQDLQQEISRLKNNTVGAGYIQDRRTQTEKNIRESFVTGWSKVEPELAPFIGVWYGYEDIRHIYPSNTKGRVCVISTGEGYGRFNTGILSNGVIITNNGQVLFKEGNFLGSGSFTNGKFVSSNGEIPFNNPRPLEALNKLLNYVFEQPDKSQIYQQFKSSSCTASLPNSSANMQPQRKNISMMNNQELSPALITAIRQDLLLEYQDDSSSYFRESKDHRIFFVDLNNDGIKEAIFYPIGGRICTNRSCGIYIYTKVGNKYKRISAVQTDRYSGVAGSKNEPSIGILKTRNKGWLDIATRFFDYDTRTEKWSRVRYESRGYTDSPLIVIPKPETILEYSSGMATDL
ncbi:MAG: hypothetical protein ACKPCP_32830, partial [Sphaerospermopsis kisseleviana]